MADGLPEKTGQRGVKDTNHVLRAANPLPRGSERHSASHFDTLRADYPLVGC